MSALADLSDDDIVECISLIENWFRDDREIEQERYTDPSYRDPESFLQDLDEHPKQRTAMIRMLNLLEDERDRRKAGASAVRLGP